MTFNMQNLVLCKLDTHYAYYYPDVITATGTGGSIGENLQLHDFVVLAVYFK